MHPESFTHHAAEAPAPSYYSTIPQPKKFDRDLINNLMDYIEGALKKKLDQIETLITKNTTNLAKIKKDTKSATSIITAYHQAHSTKLLSDDIRFFFTMVKQKKTPKKSNPPHPTTPNKNPTKNPPPKPHSPFQSTPHTPQQKTLKTPKKHTNTTSNPTQDNYSQISSRLYQNTKSIDNKRNLKYKSQSLYSEVHTPTKKEFFVSKAKKPLMRPDNNYESGQCEVKRVMRTPTKNSERYVPSVRGWGGGRLVTEDLMFHKGVKSLRGSGVKVKRFEGGVVGGERSRKREDEGSKFPEERFMKSSMGYRRNTAGGVETNVSGKKIREQVLKENLNPNSLSNRRKQKKNAPDLEQNFFKPKTPAKVPKISVPDQMQDISFVDSAEKNFFRN